MAEFILKDMVAKEGLSDQFQIDSAATSAEELGNPVYPPARRKLREHGLICEGKTARQISMADYARYDYLIGMDNANLQAMLRRFHGDPEGKLHLLLDYTDLPRDVADPWYTGDFTAAWNDIFAGCKGLLQFIRAEKE